MKIIQPARKARANTQSSDTKLISSQSVNPQFASQSSLEPSRLSSIFDGDVFDLDTSGKDGSRARKNQSSFEEPSSLLSNFHAAKLSDAKKEFNTLMAKGVRLLAMREHSVKELRDKLAVKAVSQDVVNSVIDELIENTYVSDERFTESYVRSRANRGFGPVKIRAELKSKGINNLLIEEYLDTNSVIWIENARDQYDKKYGDTEVNDYNTWSKRARFMQSRGFTMEHIQVSLPATNFD